ncbi:unnamed protein product, partial [Iphiclides podalirius]
MQTATFKGHEEVLMAVKNWVKKYACFKELNLENTVQSDVTGLLANVCMYKGTWKKSENHLVTVYNSFSYTDDIKYEARDSNKHTSATQYGEVRVDGGGVDIKVLTCLPVDKTKLSSDAKAPSICNKCFSFAVVFRDIPIFTGQLSP